MHRPPDTIPTSGPVRNTRAGLIVPPPPKVSGNSRRHSVISFSARDVTAFPIRTNEPSQKSDARRPSDLWLSKTFDQDTWLINQIAIFSLLPFIVWFLEWFCSPGADILKGLLKTLVFDALHCMAF